MDLKESRLCKSDPEKILKLRKNYEKSADEKTHFSKHSSDECKTNETACIPQLQCDDSILDFKSPKKTYLMQPKIINSNIHINKSKKKLHSNSKIINNNRKIENNKMSQKSKILIDIQQPSIESSFFKSEKKIDSADVKTAYVCPLCFKNFKDESSHTIHMKSCAIKNNISTKELMVAVELQERQAAERKSLGLLSAPILQEKKKPAPCKLTSHDDSDLQLALALSKSLYEKEEMKEWEETQMIILSSSPLSDNTEQSQKTTLQNFGFINNRNISSTNNSSMKIKRKGKPNKQTILQKCTAVERERILTERIAEILMGCKDFTQQLQEEEEQNDNVKTKIVIKNRLLQQLHQTENTLWDRTSLISTQNIFYINQSLPQIIPSKKEEQKLNKEQNIIKHSDENVSNGRSLQKEQMQKIKEIKIVEADKEELMVSSNTTKTCCKEKKFFDIFIKSWANILNDSSASDIIIFVKNGKHIWTHKLVFYVRCANILLDTISNTNTEFSTKEKICWIDIDYDIALAFLEFIYCGVISRNSKILDIDASLSSIRYLARKYKVNDLFAYLHQREFTPNITEVKNDCNTYEKCRESINENVKTTSVLKLDKSTFDTSSNYMCDDWKNNQCLRKKLLQENDNINSFEDNRTSVKKSYVLQDENILVKSSDKIDSRSNTLTNFNFRTSPDMFDDTSDMMKYNDTITTYSKEHENSNIHMLLSLIKQDADVDIYSQRSPVKKTCNVEYPESAEDTITCSKNIEQNVIEIDSDPESNLIKPIDNSQNNSSSDTPQRSNSNISKQKSNLTLFIEKIQRENAKSDSDLNIDSDIECVVQISPMKNPFHIDKCISKDLQSCNVEQLTDIEKKPSKLSIIEQCIQSYAIKNPEFYSRLSNKHEDDKQTAILHPTPISPKIKPFYDDTLNYIKSFISPTEKNSNSMEQVITTPCSLSTKITNQSSIETNSDVETNEAEISMYSKYIKNHKDNSIAKYRAIIRKNVSNSDLCNESTSDSINDNNTDEYENDEILTQKDADMIVSSDTEIESISSSISYPIILQNEHENPISHFIQQSKKLKENSKQNIKYKEKNQSVNIPKVMINLDEQTDINKVLIESNQQYNKINNTMLSTASTSKSDSVNLNVSFMQKEFRLNKTHDNQEKFVPNLITTSSSPDILNVEDQFSNDDCNKFMSESLDSKLKNSIKYSFNFENDIYLANVDIDKYDKQVSEKSQSISALNVKESKKNNAYRRYTNKNNYENIKINSSTGDDIIGDENLNRNITSLTQNFSSVRKFKKKSLSEGQIDMNRSGNQETLKHVSRQCNYSQNIGDTKTPKIFDRDVTPSPDYNNMSTPELYKEMKKYGLKVQKRSRAIKLLSYIYNELHPLVPTIEIITKQKITEISSDEDDGPPLKKLNVENDYVEQSNNMEDNDDELCSQDSNSSINSLKDKISKKMKFYETESLPVLENLSDLREAFTKLINIDKDLYNKILQYEPVNIEKLDSTLRINGFKCKLSNLMNFLDEQCITFYVPEQSSKYKIRKKI